MAVALNPNAAHIIDTYGDMLCRNGRIDEAIGEWDRSRAASDDMATAKQQQLKDQGFYRGPVDGDFARSSVAALRAWAEAGCPGL